MPNYTEKVKIDAGIDESALDVENGNIIGVNSIQMNDQSDFIREGIQFPKPGSSKNGSDVFHKDDCDTFRVFDRKPSVSGRHLKMNRPFKQKVLLFADAQPDANPDEGSQNNQVAKWREIVAGMSENHSDADWAVFAGDVVDRGHPTPDEIASNTNDWYTFDDAVEDLSKLDCGFQNVLVTTGNHDVDYRPISQHRDGNSFHEFLRRFPKQNYYMIRGNMCIVVMGDMHDDVSGRIPDYVVDWWERVVLAHQNYVVITVTHQSLDGTINAGDTNPDVRITESDRFIDRMTRTENPAKVDLWICGHHGSRQITNMAHRSAVAHNGCTFVNVGIHIPTLLERSPVDPCTYYAMFLEDGSDQIRLRHWNHETEEFISGQDILVNARTKVQLSSDFQFDGRYQHNNRFDFSIAPNRTVVGMGGKFTNQFAGPYYLDRYTLEDRQKRDIKVRAEVGVAFDIPGGVKGDEDGIRNYGFGGALTVKRTSVADANYTGSIIGWASSSSRGDDSRVKAFEGHADGSLSTPGGLRPDYQSSWTTISSSSASTQGTDFVHNLGLSEPWAMRVEVFFRESAGSRVFSWTGSSPIAEKNRHDGSVSFKDGNTITLSVGNAGVFSSDNVDGGVTRNYASGQFLVVAWKIPGLAS